MRSLALFIAMILLSGCGLVTTFKVRDAYAVETVSNQSFYETLPFQEISGFIIVTVEIEGQERKFILDTGATTKLDEDFAKTLRTTNLGKIKSVDSNGHRKYLKFATLESLKIGSIVFHDIVTSISDMGQLRVAACLEVDGIIGANAMNKCIWQLDYKTKTLVLTNTHHRLKLSGEEARISFSAIGKGVPTIPLYAGGKYCGNAIFDTGSNGGISMDDEYLDPGIPFVESQVYTMGILSTALTTQKLANVPSIELSRGYVLADHPVIFEKKSPFALIGNRFLRNYTVTFDWMKQEVLLDAYEPLGKPTYQGFGFSVRLVDSRVLVGAIQVDSEAYRAGLQLNDEVVSMNGITFATQAEDNYCHYLRTRNTWETVEVKVKRADGELELKLPRRNPLE